MQTDRQQFRLSKKNRYFWLASRGSGHFIVGYSELPEAFGASCGEGGWTHRKCYNLSCLTRVLPLNLVHSAIFKNFFCREHLFWKTLYNHHLFCCSNNPSIVKTTTKQTLIKDRDGVTQNIEERVEDLRSGSVTISKKVNKVSILSEVERCAFWESGYWYSVNYSIL